MSITLLAKNDDQIGSDTATCEIKTTNGLCIAILPTLEEAVSVARYAIKSEGGYGAVEIHSSSLAITHSSFINWLG